MAKLVDAPALEEVLGLEGSAIREYFQALRRLATPEWGFSGRQRRPPPDPINAMLSYGCNLLCHEAIAALETAGIDPMVGFLHRHRWGMLTLTTHTASGCRVSFRVALSLQAKILAADLRGGEPYRSHRWK